MDHLTPPHQVQAWIFLVGSSAGTSTTVAFLYILFRFPGFIHYVKEGGAEPDVVVRLATFYHLNVSFSALYQSLKNANINSCSSFASCSVSFLLSLY